MVGALPSQHIRDLIRKGHIKNGNEKNIQPASLDLTVSNKIYRLPFIFLPKSSQKVEDVLHEIKAEEANFDYPLEKNIPYIVKLKESLELPEHIYAYANPKSSVGRIDLRVTMLADYVSRFDAVGKKEYKGELWAIVEPKSFRVKIQPGETLLQLRLFYGDSRFGEKELAAFFREWSPLYLDEKPISMEDIKISDGDGGLIMTVDVQNEFAGWRCEGSESYLDFSKRGFYAPEEFFTRVQPKTKHVTLRKGDFYILYTRERLRVPPGFAAEIAPMDVRSGEYRSHYAGFVDPGFGYGENGEMKGLPIVLEVRPYEDNIVLIDKQPICKVVFEKVAELPDMVYGAGIGSNYSTQSGPRLSKHFINLNS